MKILVKTIYGSHLYGTDTPQSDRDYKGIFMPTKEEIYLSRIPKSINQNTKTTNATKNTMEDIDVEYYSLHYFIELACQGETVALDMLHTPQNMELITSHTWGALIQQRSLFYTKNLKAFVGYCRKQASKYGVKGSRLNDAGKVLEFLKGKYYKDFKLTYLGRLKYFWENLPVGEHIQKYQDEKGIWMYEVCGRKIQETATVEYAYNVVKKFYDNYGQRAKMAADNEGIDWKAVSHAIRVAYEMKEILQEGNITFPLKEREYIKKVKAGEFDYLSIVAPKLEELMDEVEELSLKSSLPEKVNRKYWDNWLIKIVEEEIKNNE